MTLDWVARQLAERPGSLNLTLPRYNPRPAGVIRPGSAAEKTLTMMRKHPAQWFTNHQIIVATGCTDKAVSWALLFLRSLGEIETTADSARNSRYLRYRIKPTK